jgi:hypothetical protein
MQEFSTRVVSVLYAFVEIILHVALKDLIIMHNQTILSPFSIRMEFFILQYILNNPHPSPSHPPPPQP